jgi:Flp pilus assembly pilin Flp
MDSLQPAGRDPRARLQGDSGANLVEYSMLIALIVVVCLAALQTFGSKAASKMTCDSSAVSNQSGGVTC